MIKIRQLHSNSTNATISVQQPPRKKHKMTNFTYLRLPYGNAVWITILLVAVGLTVAMLSLGWADARSQQRGQQISISIPNVRPDHAEQYLCIAHQLAYDEDGGQYIVGFNPRADAHRVHHMLMYGCQEPGVYQRDSPNLVWDCGMMHDSNAVGYNRPKSFEEGPVCHGTSNILYGWALDAPALKLPEGVGFEVGAPATNNRFLVLQVHYGHYHAFQELPDLTDNAGLMLDMKRGKATQEITKRAGVMLLISLGQVQQGLSKHQIWCDIKDDIVIHPFRYRVHTHKLGTRVLGAKIKTKQEVSKFLNGLSVTTPKSSSDELVIGDGDPQKPQMFYPVKEKNMTITKGDTVYAHCEFNNNK